MNEIDTPKIIWENDSMLVIEKPAGLVVHQDAQGNHERTLVDWIVHKYPEIEKENWEYNYRPGIVHRLDKDTSGLLMIAKNIKTFENLKNQIKNHEVSKKYYALVLGDVHPEKDIILAPIGRKMADRKKMSSTEGKSARTEYEVIKKYQKGKNNFSLLDVKIITGRTHQIRVHMKMKGCPVVGDKLYAKGRDKKIWEEIGTTRQFLHAYFLSFTDPETGDNREVKIDLAKDLQMILNGLNSTT